MFLESAQYVNKYSQKNDVFKENKFVNLEAIGKDKTYRKYISEESCHSCEIEFNFVDVYETLIKLKYDEYSNMIAENGYKYAETLEQDSHTLYKLIDIVRKKLDLTFSIDYFDIKKYLEQKKLGCEDIMFLKYLSELKIDDEARWLVYDPFDVSKLGLFYEKFNKEFIEILISKYTDFNIGQLTPGMKNLMEPLSDFETFKQENNTKEPTLFDYIFVTILAINKYDCHDNHLLYTIEKCVENIGINRNIFEVILNKRKQKFVFEDNLKNKKDFYKIAYQVIGSCVVSPNFEFQELTSTETENYLSLYQEMYGQEMIDDVMYAVSKLKKDNTKQKKLVR